MFNANREKSNALGNNMTGIKFEGDGPHEILAQSADAWPGQQITLAFRCLQDGSALETLRIVLTKDEATKLLGKLQKAIDDSSEK